MLYHHLKVLSLVGWKHHTPQPLLILIIKNILWFLPKTYLISFPAFGVLHLALPDESLGSPAQTQILRSISHISDTHSARGLTTESLQLPFFTSLTKKSFHLRPRSKRPARLSCSAYLTEEWRPSSGTWQTILILPSRSVLVMDPAFFPQRHHAQATDPRAAQNPAHSRCSDECPPSPLCF